MDSEYGFQRGPAVNMNIVYPQGGSDRQPGLGTTSLAVFILDRKREQPWNHQYPGSRCDKWKQGLLLPSASNPDRRKTAGVPRFPLEAKSLKCILQTMKHQCTTKRIFFNLSNNNAWRMVFLRITNHVHIVCAHE